MKEFKKLSLRQQNMLQYMSEYTRTRGYPPTIREIGERCDIPSTSVVNYNLNRLVEWGYLQRSNKVSRGIRIMRDIPGVAPLPRLAANANAPRVPLVGRIAAGEPISLPEDIAHHVDEDDYVTVPQEFLQGFDENEVFALSVRGDSMIDSMIQDGDIVILRQQCTADNGEMVAVWLPEDCETTLKHFYREADSIRLQPANAAYDPIFVHPANCEIKGKVLSVMRSYG